MTILVTGELDGSPSMRNAMTFDQSILIAASADELFALTQDYSRRLAWDPIDAVMFSLPRGP